MRLASPCFSFSYFSKEHERMIVVTPIFFLVPRRERPARAFQMHSKTGINIFQKEGECYWLTAGKRFICFKNYPVCTEIACGVFAFFKLYGQFTLWRFARRFSYSLVTFCPELHLSAINNCKYCAKLYKNNYIEIKAIFV
jgi:hypothetical protein